MNDDRVPHERKTSLRNKTQSEGLDQAGNRSADIVRYTLDLVEFDQIMLFLLGPFVAAQSLRYTGSHPQRDFPEGGTTVSASQ